MSDSDQNLGILSSGLIQPKPESFDSNVVEDPLFNHEVQFLPPAPTSVGHSKHKTVPIEYAGFSADIDEGIAPLILELWKADIMTFNSCQENRPGIIWIEFAHPVAVEDFLNIVTSYDEEPCSLYRRIRGEGWLEDLPEDEVGNWEYDVLGPHDIAVDETLTDNEIFESSSGPCEFAFTMSVRFPVGDYQRLLERLTAFNLSGPKP